MLLTNAPRKHLYRFIPEGLRIVELGVLRGDNARHIAVSCAPSKLVLVDAWSPILRADMPHLSADEFERMREGVAPYFGGDITEPSTHDRNFETCRRQLDGFKGVELVFSRTRTDDFLLGGEGLAQGPFDVAYVDANHQYEGVLSDLKGVLPLVSPGGLIWLNDASINVRAFEQRMGVLQAAVTAVKLFGLVPLLITNDFNADLVLWQPSEDPACAGLQFLSRLQQVDHDLFELPAELLGAYSQRIPFGFSNRAVTSLSTERSYPIESRRLQQLLDTERTARTPQGRRNVPAGSLARARWVAATRDLLRSVMRSAAR